MLAGDVTASIVNGNLIIKGDRNDNEIAVTQSGTTLTVTGTNTTVNSNAAPAVLTGFMGSIKLRMKHGDDDVTLTGVTATGLHARLGKGDDSLDIEHCTINGDTTLNGKRGNDTVLVDTVAPTLATHFNGLLNINLGRGNGTDTLHIVNAIATGETNIAGRGGADSVTIAGSTFTTLDTELGRGNDSLSITTTNVSGKTTLNGGKGTNSIDKTGSTFTGGLTQKNFT